MKHLKNLKNLKNLIQEGIDSGIAEDFHPEKHLELLKANRKNDYVFSAQ
jgi:antitoxin ParD1/3/4